MSSNVSGAATASWVQGLDPAIRHKIRELHVPAPAKNLLVLIFPAMWVLMAWLVITFPGWPTRVAAYVVNGIAFMPWRCSPTTACTGTSLDIDGSNAG